MIRKSLLAALPLLVACGGGNVASEVAKPPEFAPKDQAKCGVSKSQARPLIVEWPSSDRATLEARVKQGVVPVRYVGCEMEVLARCSVPKTKYGYTGITPKSDRIVMRDADELYANIPVYAAKFEGSLQRAGALTVSMTIVGRYEADRPSVSKEELQGECGDATHVVSALTVGAFEFFAGAEAEAAASAGALGVEAGGKSRSQRETLNRDGEDAACRNAKGDDQGPPFGCGALLRLEVVPLGEARAATPSCAPGTTWNGSQCVAEARAQATPPPPPPPASVTPCGMGDGARCRAACDQGEQESCVTLGIMLREGKGVAKDNAQALALLRKGCEAGKPKGCVQAGEILYNVEPKDLGAAVELFRKGCDAGEPTGCTDLGWALSSGQGVARDDAAAAAAFGKACTGQTAVGCLGLGLLYRDGKGVAKDARRAGELFKKACGAGVAAACSMAKPAGPELEH